MITILNQKYPMHLSKSLLTSRSLVLGIPEIDKERVGYSDGRFWHYLLNASLLFHSSIDRDCAALQTSSDP